MLLFLFGLFAEIFIDSFNHVVRNLLCYGEDLGADEPFGQKLKEFRGFSH